MKIITNYQLNKTSQSRPNFGDSYMNMPEMTKVLKNPTAVESARGVQDNLKNLSQDVDTIVIPHYDGTVTVRVQRLTPHIAETTHPVLKPFKQFWRALKITYAGLTAQPRTVSADHLLGKSLLNATLDLKDILQGTTKRIAAEAAHLA